MMGRLPSGQNELFYDFCLEERVPGNHVLRAIDRFLDFSAVRQRLEPYYSEVGRPSVDPELMVRMLLVGYCFGIRSERRLCEEVDLNLAYRWFCRLGLEGQVPNHSTFSRNRHGRFRDSELFRHVFETVVQRRIDERLVRGEGFAVDASVIEADVNDQSGFFGKDGIDWERPGRKNRAVREYLESFDNDAEAVAAEVSGRRRVSTTDPEAGWTSATGGPAFYAYSTNYLIDLEAGIILDTVASRPNVGAEAKAAREMLEHTQARFGLTPQRLLGDAGYGSAAMLGWVVETKGITPHIPVFDKSEGKPGQFGRSDFVWKPEANRYICPAGKALTHGRKKFKQPRTGITKDNTRVYRASSIECEPCPLKSQCCPKEPARKIARSIHEDARDLARSLVDTPAYEQSRKDRKKVEMLFAHLKRMLGFRRLRLRGRSGANDEFLLAATVQNLKRMSKLSSPTGLDAIPAG